jgi:hypothetical protein
MGRQLFELHATTILQGGRAGPGEACVVVNNSYLMGRQLFELPAVLRLSCR